MKAIVPLILFLAISAFSEKPHWTDENGCSYCYGHHMNGSCGLTNGTLTTAYAYTYPEPSFHIRKLNDNYFQTGPDAQAVFEVYCKNRVDYCKTINDSTVVSLMPSLKERKSYCKEQTKKLRNTGMTFYIPNSHSSVKFLCDFIQFDYKKSLVKVLDTGVCPVQEKAGFNRLNQPVQFFYNLYITKKKSFEVEKEQLYYQVQQSQTLYKRNFFRKDFFTLGDCSNSNCEILNYIGGKPQDFDIKCNFIKKKDGQIGKVQVVGEGVCPIEITGKNNEKQVYYVRSVKDGDAYRLLMTNKRK